MQAFSSFLFQNIKKKVVENKNEHLFTIPLSTRCCCFENNNWKLAPVYSTTRRSLCSQYLNWVVISVISVLHANAACPQITNLPPHHSSTYRTSCREKQQHKAQQQPFSWISAEASAEGCNSKNAEKMLHKDETVTSRWFRRTSQQIALIFCWLQPRKTRISGLLAEFLALLRTWKHSALH